MYTYVYIYSSIRLYNCTHDYNRLHVYPRNMPVCEKTHPHTQMGQMRQKNRWRDGVSLAEHVWLVVSTPLKIVSELGWLFPIYGKTKNFQTTNQKTNKHWIDHWCPAVNHTLKPAKNPLVSMALTMALGGLPCLASRTYSWFCQCDKQGLRTLYIIYIKSGVQYFLQYLAGESPSI